MKALFATAVLVSFVVLAVFGVFGVHSAEQSHDGECIAATAQGTDCPKQNDLLGYLTFHLDVFRGFSMAIFGENILASLLALTLFVTGAGLALFSLFLGNLAPPQSNFAYFRYRRRENFSSPPRQRLLRWLALHENSPAIL